MNKILRYSFVALMAMMFGLTANATKIVFADLNLTNGTQYTDPFDGGDYTVTFSGGGNDGKYYTTGSGIRVYGGGKMTIKPKSGKITSITLTYDGTNKPADGTVVNEGTYDAETGVWTGTSTEVVFTRPSGSGHWRIQSVDATVVVSSEDVANPEFSVSEGMFFEAQSVALSCATEGAKILYTLDGSDPAYTDAENYTGVFYDGNALTISKTTTIKAMAVKDGNKSSIVSAKYTIIPTEAKGTAESPFSVADGLTVVNALDDNATSPKIFIKGYIVGDITISSGQASFKIADAADATENLITVFKAKGLKNDNFAEGDAKAGDVVVIIAPLQKYVKTVEEVKTVTPETQYGYIYSINGKTEFDPINFEGDGTEAKPYTIADLKQMRASIYPTDAVWVKGIIVGAIKDNKLVTTEIETASNIAIAATSAETEYANIVPVELKAETDIKTALNVVDNPTNIGKEVLLQGKIKTYFSVTGVKDLEAYKLNAVETKYTITITNTEHGNLTLDKYEAAEGEKVSVIGMSVDDGYEMKEPTITAESGAAVTIGGSDEEGHYIIMPASNVTIALNISKLYTITTVFNSEQGDVRGITFNSEKSPILKGAGKNIQFTVTAKQGFEVESVTAACEDKTPITVNVAADNSYYEFQMPAQNVTITATFSETLGITNVTAAKAENAVRYNLAGQKVNNDYKGVVIMNGKKMLNK